MQISLQVTARVIRTPLDLRAMLCQGAAVLLKSRCKQKGTRVPNVICVVPGANVSVCHLCLHLKTSWSHVDYLQGRRKPHTHTHTHICTHSTRDGSANKERLFYVLLVIVSGLYSCP